VEILPERAAHGARDPDVVLEPGPPAIHRLVDQVGGDRHPALHPQPPVVLEVEVLGRVADDEPAVPLVPDQDVGAEAEDEVRHPELAGAEHGPCEVVGGGGLEVEVGWPADLEGGERRQRHVAREVRTRESCAEAVDGAF